MGYSLASSASQFLSVMSDFLRHFATPRTAARQASQFIANSQSLLKLMSIKSVVPSNHLSLELNRASRSHENVLTPCCSGEGKSSAGKWCFVTNLCAVLHPPSHLSCRVVAVQQVWGQKHLLLPSNLTLEVKEKLFIILVTQQPRHFFAQFLCCFC